MKTSRKVGCLIAGAALASAGGAWLALRASPPETRFTEPAPPVRFVNSLGHPATVPTTAAAPRAVDLPEGMTSAQRQMLREQLKHHPQREAEIARVSAAVTYLSRLDRFRARRPQASTDASPEDRELAAWLLAQLRARLANREVSGSEGRRLNEALLDALAATPAQRDAAQQALDAALPVDPSVLARAALDLRYQRESTALLAAWQAQAPAARDAQQLEAALLDLRRALINHPASADATAGVLR